MVRPCSTSSGDDGRVNPLAPCASIAHESIVATSGDGEAERLEPPIAGRHPAPQHDLPDEPHGDRDRDERGGHREPRRAGAQQPVADEDRDQREHDHDDDGAVDDVEADVALPGPRPHHRHAGGTEQQDAGHRPRDGELLERRARSDDDHEQGDAVQADRDDAAEPQAPRPRLVPGVPGRRRRDEQRRRGEERAHQHPGQEERPLPVDHEPDGAGERQHGGDVDDRDRAEPRREDAVVVRVLGEPALGRRDVGRRGPGAERRDPQGHEVDEADRHRLDAEQRGAGEREVAQHLRGDAPRVDRHGDDDAEAEPAEHVDVPSVADHVDDAADGQLVNARPTSAAGTASQAADGIEHAGAEDDDDDREARGESPRRRPRRGPVERDTRGCGPRATDATVISTIGGTTTGVSSHHGGVRSRSDTTSTTAQVR